MLTEAVKQTFIDYYKVFDIFIFFVKAREVTGITEILDDAALFTRFVKIYLFLVNILLEILYSGK